MNQNTLDTLNYYEVKNIVKSYCTSNLGKNLIDNIKPSYDLKLINHKLNETSEARTLIDNGYVVPLKGVSDIYYIVNKLEKGMTLDIEDLLLVTDFLRGCKTLKKFFQNKEDYAPNLTSYSYNITVLEDIEDEINKTIVGNGISSSATKELKKIRKNIDECEGKIKLRLDKFITNSTNKQYLQDTLIVQRNNKYVVPIKAMYKNKVDGIVVEVSSKGTTYFIEPNTVTKYSTQLEILKLEEEVEVFKILANLSELVNDKLFELNMNIDVIAKYDMIFAKGKYSAKINGIQPKLNNCGVLNINMGVHPLINDFEPLNFNIGFNYRGLLITGPNAGGKTVVLKTIGILTLMTMSGFHIKANTNTAISIFKNIFVDIGDNQSIENSLSTFSSHMSNLSNIIKQSNKSTLALLDEIGSGTEPKEGAGLGIAILEELYKKGVVTVSSTHYGEIKTFAEEHSDFEIGAMAFEKDTLEPLYKLKIGKSGNSNAFYIAEKMGIPKSVREKAKYYIKTKDYDTSLLDNSKVIKYSLYTEKNESEDNFSIGDKVILTESNTEAIVYEGLDNFGNIKVYMEKTGEVITTHSKRTKILIKASDLYPKGYDISSLFTDFKTRKLNKDIERGSKKALKKLEKERKSN